MSRISQWLGRRAADLMQTRPVVVREDEPLIGAIGRMRAADSDCAVIVDAGGRARGLLDADRVLRQVVFDAVPEQPVGTVAADPPPTISADAPLYRAAVRLQRGSAARLVVVDGAGRPQGVLRRDAVLAAALSGLLGALEPLGEDGDIAALAAAKSALADIAAVLLAEHEPAMQVLAVINGLGFGLTTRVCELAAASLAADGWGEAPGPFAVIIMGSGGRAESLLAPDQDNGLILGDPAEAERPRADDYYAEYARRLTRDLATVGFPLCPGNVMATNPMWRRTLTQWRDMIDGWVRARSGAALLNADIFFDFRPAFGRMELAVELRRHVTRAVKGNGPFLNQMAWRQADEASDGGLLGRLLGGFTGSSPQEVDLKLHGTLPLVEGVRLLALWAGVESTGTLPRLAELRALGLIEPTDHDDIAEALAFLLDLLLRRQVADAQAGRPVGTVISGQGLRRQERERLDSTLRRIDSFRRHAAARLLGTAPAAGL